MFTLEYRNLDDVRARARRLQSHVRYLFKFSAPGDPFNQVLFNLNRPNRSVLVRLWPGDSSGGIAEVIDTGMSYARRRERDIRSARFLLGMQDRPIRLLEQRGEGFCVDNFEPVLVGDAPAIWHENASVVIEPGETSAVFPPNAEADLAQLLAAKQSLRNLQDTIAPLGSSALADCAFVNYA